MTELSPEQQQIIEYHKKQYERNLKTWAIDRALETLKITPQATTAWDVIAAADTLCGWVTQTPKEWPVPAQDEAEAMLNDLKMKGEIKE